MTNSWQLQHVNPVKCSQHESCHVAYHICAREHAAQSHKCISPVGSQEYVFLTGDGVSTDLISLEVYIASYQLTVTDFDFCQMLTCSLLLMRSFSSAISTSLHFLHCAKLLKLSMTLSVTYFVGALSNKIGKSIAKYPE